ncbi:MAG: CPBP family intramembrane metalloprotease, partial [Clostridia bacterium]|nr:CPBP family intramembrane metalloprotease [Clostridia bacterium]
ILLIAAYLFKVDIANNMPVWFTWMMTVVNQGSLVFGVFVYGKMVNKPLIKETKITNKIGVKSMLIIPAIVVASIMAFLPLATGFVKLIELITHKAPSVNMAIGNQWWEIIISMVFLSVLPAIGEEILFRGSVARGLKRKNYLFAIIMSGFMFSIFHGNPAQTVHQFFIGMIFAYVYFVTGSLLGSALAHFLNNALAVVLEVAQNNLEINLTLGAEIGIYVAMSICGIVALYFLLRCLMKFSKEEKGVAQNTDKMAWAKDLGKAFTIQGIKDNYNRLNSSLKTLFNDECDNWSIDGDIEIDSSWKKTEDLSTDNGTQNNEKEKDNKIEDLLVKANKETIRKRKRFDIISMIVAVGLALCVWVFNLFLA